MPLHVLVFLLPLMIVYEFGSFWYLRDAAGVMRTVGARNLLVRFFEVFGAGSFHLPAITLVVVLLLWHVLNRDPWKIRPGVLIGMALESAVLVLPLLVLGLIMDSSGSKGRLGAVAIENALPALRAAPWQERLTLSIGAGLYEELVFRLVMITGLHLILADAFRLPKHTSAFIACLASAVAFALYHDISPAGILNGADLKAFTFLTAAGLYFAGLFLVRGFGIVVATHAVYDILVLVVIQPNP